MVHFLDLAGPAVLVNNTVTRRKIFGSTAIACSAEQYALTLLVNACIDSNRTSVDSNRADEPVITRAVRGNSVAMNATTEVTTTSMRPDINTARLENVPGHSGATRVLHDSLRISLETNGAATRLWARVITTIGRRAQIVEPTHGSAPVARMDAAKTPSEDGKRITEERFKSKSNSYCYTK